MPSKKKKQGGEGLPPSATPSTAERSPAASQQEPAAPIVLTPRLEPMPAEPGRSPESGIGNRLKYARKQLDVSIEALSRYSVNFDTDEKKGVSPTSLLRYEAGEFLPGARELRILCDALDVPPRWLLLGEVENRGEDVLEQTLISALEGYVVARAIEANTKGRGLRRMFPKYPTHIRYKWLEEAKQPKLK